MSSADRESWTAAWRDAATGREALALPARLLDAGLRARVGADARARLDLISVERAILGVAPGRVGG
ncbi:MAG: hypothetical protein DRQ55_09270 [Planctomycetota bacterium]|nr:MAG: hypothetical protein DRQ55_09270 [Planctomycetota bacterium]